MTETTVFQLSQPRTFTDPLTDVLCSVAAHAVEAEVAALLANHADRLTEGDPSDGSRRPGRRIMRAEASAVRLAANR